MSVSAGRRTWDEASSPAAVRLAREYEQAWRDHDGRRRRPDPQAFLDSAGPSIDEAGARLAILRADLSLRWEAGEKVGARWYLERLSDLSEDTIVALVYEEFCLREEDGDAPDPSQFLERFPEVAPALRRVLDIHGLVGSGSTRAASLLSPTGSGEYACAFPESGQTIAGFFLVEELGRGSFARVFLARERELADRPVALKVTRRGSREPQTLARLQHTHIVPVHSYRIDKATGLHLLCMPYFGRTTLARVLQATREAGLRSGAGLAAALERLEPSEAPAGPYSGRAALERRDYDRAVAWWGARLAEALEHAHDRGVLHRDIKPSNVLVTDDGLPMLLDFNLAREPLEKDAGPDDAPGGTVDYMSPEHLRALAAGEAEGTDHRSDVYSLGVVLYEALTGVRPFTAPRRGSSLCDALHRAADDRNAARPHPRAVEPLVPPALDAIVRRCLEPDPADRYRSAGELAEDLRAVADDLPLAHAREPMASRAVGWLRRKRRKLAVAAAVAVPLVTVVGLTLVGYLGVRLIKLTDRRSMETRVDQAMDAFRHRDYEKSKLLFDTVTDLGNRIDKLDPREYRDHRGGPMGMARLIVRELRGLGDVRDLDDMKALARDKGELAGRYAQVYADAGALHAAADRLRFELLLHLRDLPAIWPELRQALEPFYVLENADWTGLPHQFGMLDEVEARKVRDEVDGLLFLWVKAVIERLSEEGRIPPGTERWSQANRIIGDAIDICDRAEGFAESKAPWLALRASLVSLPGAEGLPPSRGPRGPEVGREPADVRTETSALACFEWAELHFNGTDVGRSIAWMRHAVRLRGEDYWYQYFLAYLEDLAGHSDEALEHYSTAAALQPESPYVRYSRARLYRSRGRWESAFDDLNLALNGLRDRPAKSRMIRLERGVLYQMMGDDARARADFDAVIRYEATDDHGRAARLNRADLDVESGALRRARAGYDALISEDPADHVARHSRAILELRLGEAALADRDLSALLSMRRIKPTDRVEYLAERAQARLLMGRPDLAVADAEQARDLDRTPSHERLAQRALLAARRYDRLRIDRPDDISLLPLRGPRLEAELRAAAAALGRIASGSDGAAFRAGLTRAVILAALGESRNAVASADRAVAASRHSAEARLVRARVLAAVGDRRGAWAEVEYSRTIHPDDPGLSELRGALRLADGDPRAAIEDFNRALSLGARDGVRSGKAAALLALGDDRAALDEWSLALRRDPELPEAFLGRARTYFLLREWDLGLGDLEQAAAWGHADPRIETAVALGYLQCLPERPGRLPRLLIHLRRALGAYWHSLDGRYRLAGRADD